MPDVNIGKLFIKFPKDPYSCQVKYMEKVIEALDGKSNALLESPTGTGKTLCLLCSSLAWQEAQKMTIAAKGPTDSTKLESNDQLLKIKKEGYVSKVSLVDSTVSVILYATRTHSQLTQVIGELAETAYRPRMTVLGSREQLCIHHNISKLKGSAINHACNTLVAKRSCSYNNNLQEFSKSSSIDNTQIADIEDLNKIGTRKSICPYYLSKDTSANAEIVFMPYNYLLDASVRKNFKIQWENAIVIFDEAHSLERVASEAASFTFTSTDIAFCIKELQEVLRLIKSEYESSNQGDSGARITSLNSVEKPTLESVTVLLRGLFELEQIVDKAELTMQDSESKDPSCTYGGIWLLERLSHAKLDTLEIVLSMKSCGLFLIDAAQDSMVNSGSGDAHVFSSEPKLMAFSNGLERMIRTSLPDIGDYKVFIKEVPVQNSNKHITLKVSADPSRRRQVQRIVNFWCFSSGVALKELKSLGVRSVLLTSGTLSPMEAMKEDLKIPFNVELQNPHVIDPNQIWIGALSTGASGVTLNSNFKNRDSQEYKKEIGETILLLHKTLLSENAEASSQTMGGVLVFFPTYKSMQDAIDCWKNSEIYQKLVNAIGKVIVEPQGSTQFKPTNEKSNEKGIKNEKVNFMLDTGSKKLIEGEDGSKTEEEMFQGIVKEFDNAILHRGQCLLLAVCRGKVSEGIDFSNNKGRIVIITGIPFAPFMDPWVKLKKDYLDGRCSIQPSNKLAAVGVSSVNGAMNSKTGGSATSNTNSWAQAKSIIDAQKIGNSILNSSNKLTYPPSSSISSSSHLTSSYPPHPPSSSEYPTASYPPRPSSSTSSYPPSQPSSSHLTASYPPPPPSSSEYLTASYPPSSGASNLSVSSKSNFTGQMWYNQSASRAVNQALGRIIRHRYDWGAIFLLDERFKADYQVMQLSSWIRPRVKKFSSFSESRASFSSFLHGVAIDPRLHYSAPRPVSTAAAAAPKSTLVTAAENPFKKTIEIDESLFGSQIDQEFIPSDLIENSSWMRLDSTSTTYPKTMMTMTTTTTRPRKEEKESQAHPQDLHSIIEKMKGKSSHVTEIASKPLTGMLGNLFSLDASSKAKESHQKFGLSSTIDLTSCDSPDEKTPKRLSLDIPPTVAGASVKCESTDPSSASTSRVLLDVTQTMPQFSSAIMTQDIPKSQMKSFSQFRSSNLKQPSSAPPIAGKNEREGASELKKLLDELKCILSETQMKAVKDIFIDLKKQGGLRSISHIKPFLNLLLKTLSSLSSARQHDIALRLSCLVEDDTLKVSYSTMVRQRFPQPSQAKVKSEATVSNLQSIRKVEDIVGEEDITNVGSKRAKLLLQLNEERTRESRDIKPSSEIEKNQRVEMLQRIQAFTKMDAFRPQSSSSSSQACSEANSKLKCIICKTDALKPGRGPCGHICCQECWMQWLKVKQECPMCRHPASLETVTNIRLLAKKK